MPVFGRGISFNDDVPANLESFTRGMSSRLRLIGREGTSNQDLASRATTLLWATDCSSVWPSFLRFIQKFIFPGDLIHPKNCAVWHGFIAIIAVYSCLVTPIEVAFFNKEDAPWQLLVMDLITNALFFIDFVITFRIIYKDRKTMLWVFSRKKIALR